MSVAFLKNKNRNDSISLGALVIIKELELSGIKVDICSYESTHKYKVVLVSMTSTLDIFDLYREMKAANWQKRKFVSVVGGFGCQNPFALHEFVDFAYFGRAENDISGFVNDILQGKEVEERLHVTRLDKPKEKVFIRPVQQLYKYDVKYGKNCSNWKEDFVGCPNSCMFCHYSWNRKSISNGNSNKYINDGLSSGSPEIMLKDVPDIVDKIGRFTTAMDGYSERLRYLFGKWIRWDMIEEAFDHTAAFKGNSFIKLYNISNFPTETEADEQEFVNFCEEYVSSTSKKDGVLSIEVYNTAFRPSINTPMQRMPVRLYPEARRENLKIAVGCGIVIKYTHLIQGAWMHLQDVIGIRYNDNQHDVIDYIATDKQFEKLNNAAKIDYFVNKFDITDFVRQYDIYEPFISDRVITAKEASIRRHEIKLFQELTK